MKHIHLLALSAFVSLMTSAPQADLSSFFKGKKANSKVIKEVKEQKSINQATAEDLKQCTADSCADFSTLQTCVDKAASGLEACYKTGEQETAKAMLRWSKEGEAEGAFDKALRKKYNDNINAALVPLMKVYYLAHDEKLTAARAKELEKVLEGTPSITSDKEEAKDNGKEKTKNSKLSHLVSWIYGSVKNNKDAVAGGADRLVGEVMKLFMDYHTDVTKPNSTASNESKMFADSTRFLLCSAAACARSFNVAVQCVPDISFKTDVVQTTKAGYVLEVTLKPKHPKCARSAATSVKDKKFWGHNNTYGGLNPSEQKAFKDLLAFASSDAQSTLEQAPEHATTSFSIEFKGLRDAKNYDLPTIQMVPVTSQPKAVTPSAKNVQPQKVVPDKKPMTPAAPVKPAEVQKEPMNVFPNAAQAQNFLNFTNTLRHLVSEQRALSAKGGKDLQKMLDSFSHYEEMAEAMIAKEAPSAPKS